MMTLFLFYFKMVDAFVGKFVVESRDNYDGFMKGVGLYCDCKYCLCRCSF